MTEMLNTEQIQNVLHGITIPPQPQILVDLQMEQVMPNPDIRRIAQLISKDPALSGAMLKVVNSAYFGLKKPITSIQQAVQLLGLPMVMNILNGISIRNEMSDDSLIVLGRFWDTATNIAQISALLSKRLGLGSADEAYALGLFHNCGVPLLVKRFPEYISVMQQAYSATDETIIDVENRLLQTNHAVIGYFVARSWRLPMHLCEVIDEHHNCHAIFLADDPYANEKKALLAVLKIAEHICGNYQMLGRCKFDAEWNQIKEPLLTYTGLSPLDFANIREDLSEMQSQGAGEFIQT